MFWILVTGLWAAMLISPFILLFMFLPTGKACPRCAHETLPIRSRLLRPFRSVATFRWCIECGWEGVARNVIVRRPIPTLEVVPEDRNEGDEPWRQTA